MSDLDVLRRAAGSTALSTREIDVARYAHDASHYLLRPRAVLTAESIEQVAAIMAAASREPRPPALTFRSGGTSLSGQSVTDEVLVDVRHGFQRVEVLDDGARVRCQPGAVLRRVNAMLARHGRRLGPDPASEIACTVGGVVANNASGMTSGTAATAYRTVESMVFVLPSGTVLDTAEPHADRLLAAMEPELHAGLLRLRDHVRGDTTLRRTVEHQYSMKNTMGYGLNSLLDHDRPIDILAHLVVGSEGTLGFLGEVTFRTLPVLPHAATGLLVLPSIDAATGVIPDLTAGGAVAVELMDAAALRVAQRDPGADDMLRSLPVEDHTALLVEVQHETSDGLAELVAALDPVLEGARGTVAPLTTDAARRGQLWRIRKGLYATVAGARPTGTTALLEDVVVPGPRLGEAVAGLGGLLTRYGYQDAVIFGHAKDANLHFMINPDFDDARSRETYAAFSEDLAGLVLGADGSLKAEHGTGRMMAPFVRRQFGDDLYQVMREIKSLCDPHGILAPGVVIGDDETIHLRDIKQYPAVDADLDRCVECGFCESTCPSRNTTTTPRQRIAVLRETATADPQRRAELERAWDYSAVDTCAADSLCVVACPVSIDTGKAMKASRADRRGPAVQRAGRAVAESWAPVTGVLRGALGVADHLPAELLSGTTRLVRGVVGERGRDWIPQTGRALPGPGRPRRELRGTDDDPLDDTAGRADAVFFPACIGSLFAPEASGDGRDRGAAAAFVDLCDRAGLRLAVPPRIDGLCCGTVWESKGLVEGATEMAQRVAEDVWRLSDEGRLPVVCDASSCTHGLQGIASRLTGEVAERWGRLQVVDAVTFTRERLLDLLPVAEEALLDRVVVHPTCATVHIDAVEDLVAVAGATARQAVVPPSWGCCGTAGDRGMLHPELTADATRAEAAEVAELERAEGPFDAYVSSNRTCEMGMRDATARPYRHVLEILEERTRRQQPGSPEG